MMRNKMSKKGCFLILSFFIFHVTRKNKDNIEVRYFFVREKWKEFFCINFLYVEFVIVLIVIAR